jgi:hypothetical protein
MKRIRIIHNTQYHYRQPATFGPHRAMLRPREGHDVHMLVDATTKALGGPPI